MRGALYDSYMKVLAERIIPADAGSTTGIWHDCRRPRDHPRGCGEHVFSRSTMIIR